MQVSADMHTPEQICAPGKKRLFSLSGELHAMETPPMRIDASRQMFEDRQHSATKGNCTVPILAAKVGKG